MTHTVEEPLDGKRARIIGTVWLSAPVRTTIGGTLKIESVAISQSESFSQAQDKILEANILIVVMTDLHEPAVCLDSLRVVEVRREAARVEIGHERTELQ